VLSDEKRAQCGLLELESGITKCLFRVFRKKMAREIQKISCLFITTNNTNGTNQTEPFEEVLTFGWCFLRAPRFFSRKTEVKDTRDVTRA